MNGANDTKEIKIICSLRHLSSIGIAAQSIKMSLFRRRRANEVANTTKYFHFYLARKCCCATKDKLAFLFIFLPFIISSISSRFFFLLLAFAKSIFGSIQSFFSISLSVVIFHCFFLFIGIHFTSFILLSTTVHSQFYLFLLNLSNFDFLFNVRIIHTHLHVDLNADYYLL